jgi:hypothetical protein
MADIRLQDVIMRLGKGRDASFEDIEASLPDDL